TGDAEELLPSLHAAEARKRRDGLGQLEARAEARERDGAHRVPQVVHPGERRVDAAEVAPHAEEIERRGARLRGEERRRLLARVVALCGVERDRAAGALRYLAHLGIAGVG